ncbi:hypothetical protein P775_07100 [Puniceibacterium antarcticum]|uniref:Uncharacterized protein n=1 Tax=Puniceibacterium antarcticum TaxID=1206336 RepID=A0A2G8RH71_9RHOB|nr:hypothetical protein [Puniceibacterium antarcticum]PIL20924.1 hypothetical protein P775_07100 [Puniceibacterium antarcticum]
MANSTTQLTRDPAFDRFLGAAVGEDRHGTNVTVLSMFARLGIDPWDEASDLAGMADVPARKRLQALLSRFKDVPALVANSGEVVARLLAFLPEASASPRRAPDGTTAGLALPRLGAPIHWIIATVLLLVWLAVMAQG